jgi:hypothetical protein
MLLQAVQPIRLQYSNQIKIWRTSDFPQYRKTVVNLKTNLSICMQCILGHSYILFDHGVTLYMVYWTPYPWYFDPLPMVYQPHYPWNFDPTTHGISNPLSMVYRTPFHSIMDPLPMVFWPHDRIEYTSVLRCIACIWTNWSSGSRLFFCTEGNQMFSIF